MDDNEEELRNRFNFGAPPSWNSTSSSTGGNASRTYSGMPGSYPQDPEEPEIKDESPTPAEPPRQHTAADPPPQNVEKTCRICLSGAEDGRPSINRTNLGRLISPCRCRGTMKYVHITCLNTWRYSSPNAKSVYQCDQCKYRYNFNRTHYASIVGSLYSRVPPL